MATIANATQGLPARVGLRRTTLLTLYVATIFLSALLLFGVQPMFTKMVLPVLGGSPSVWSVAMVVFQALLLAGYAYAHALVRHVPARVAAPLHLTVMAGALLVMPIALASGWGEPPPKGEALWLIGLFIASVGLPFFALSANGPLLQAWFARSDHPQAADPYFLYGASNIGSFAALIAYPVVIEPALALKDQSRGWMLGFAVLAVLIAVCAALTLGARSERPSASPASAVRPSAGPATWRQRLGWIVLSLVPSGLLISVTAHISTDIAAVPLLWVLPLALFLLTFVLAFRRNTVVSPLVLGILQVGGTALVLMPKSGTFPIWMTLTVHLGLFVVNALICHRALYANRPGTERLTEFYLCLSAGGVLGGIFCGLAAPHLFSTVLEYPILIVAALLCRPGLLIGGRAQWRAGLRAAAAVAIAVPPAYYAANAALPPQWLVVSLVGPLAVLMLLLWRRPAWTIPLAVALAVVTAGLQGSLGAKATSRSFFGVHRITTSDDGRFRILRHGTTMHGAIRIANDDGTPVEGRPEPITYYAMDGAMGRAIAAIREAQGGALPAAWVVGLGSGSLACHARTGERWTFFEIDAEIVRIASDPALFRFLDRCGPGVSIVLGDARQTLARQAGSAGLIVLDAFSSDAIPVHLLTREAVGLYLSKLTPEGALVVHVSNRHLELRHILARVAAEHGLLTYLGNDRTDAAMEARFLAGSNVVVMTRDPRHLGPLAASARWERIEPDMGRRPWTDDFGNIIEAMIDHGRP